MQKGKANCGTGSPMVNKLTGSWIIKTMRLKLWVMEQVGKEEDGFAEQKGDAV